MVMQPVCFSFAAGAFSSPCIMVLRSVTVSKQRAVTLVSPMAYVVEIAAYAEITGEAVAAEDIIYQDLDGAMKPCVPCPRHRVLLILRERLTCVMSQYNLYRTYII